LKKKDDGNTSLEMKKPQNWKKRQEQVGQNKN
jgi:hypothetical protein